MSGNRKRKRSGKHFWHRPTPTEFRPSPPGQKPPSILGEMGQQISDELNAMFSLLMGPVPRPKPHR